MINELQLLSDLVFRQIGKITSIEKDNECEEYLGYNFKLNSYNVKFRKSKITPKKIGQFVTLWKRNEEKQTEPFHVNDNFDFYIIACFDNDDSGFFLFSKNILAQNKFLSSNEKEGKRGFRVYPEWVETENNQAKKTQAWQVKYFIDLNTDKANLIQQINTIFKERNIK